MATHNKAVKPKPVADDDEDKPVKFTDRGVAALRPKLKVRVIWEPVSHGQGNLGLRIWPSGVKTWIYMYRFEGKPRMQTLGNYPTMTVADAHAAQANAAQARAHGQDPGGVTVALNKATREAATVNELARQFLELYAKPRKRSADRDEELLKRNVLPAWGTHKANAIGRGDVAKLLDSIVARGAPIPANRTRSVLSKMYRWALSRELVDHNPVDGVPAPALEHRRDRVLDNDEVAQVLGRLDKTRMQTAAKLAIRFQFLTAARVGEVAGAQWSEVNEVAAVWTIPAARSKNKRAHRLPLSPQAVAVLQEAKAIDRGNGAVFPAAQSGVALSPEAVAAAIRDAMPLFEVERFTPHDIRRTVATGISEDGASRVVVSKVLNHIDASVTAIYDRHSYEKEMRGALDGWGRRLAALVLAAGDGKTIGGTTAQPPQEVKPWLYG